MKIQTILGVTTSMLGLVLCSLASASSISQHTLQQIPDGASFDISTYGQLDWAIAGVNEKAGGNMVSTTGSANTTTLATANPGGISLDFFAGNYPFFTYNDGASPISSAASPGDHSGYQYDEPAVDIFVSAGSTRLSVWLAAGYVGDATYEATLADGATTGAVSYWSGDATYG